MPEVLTVRPMQFFDQDVDGRFKCEACRGSCWVGFDEEQMMPSLLHCPYCGTKQEVSHFEFDSEDEDDE